MFKIIATVDAEFDQVTAPALDREEFEDQAAVGMSVGLSGVDVDDISVYVDTDPED